jgi:hypothetical protein
MPDLPGSESFWVVRVFDLEDNFRGFYVADDADANTHTVCVYTNLAAAKEDADFVSLHWIDAYATVDTFTVVRDRVLFFDSI